MTDFTSASLCFNVTITRLMMLWGYNTAASLVVAPCSPLFATTASMMLFMECFRAVGCRALILW